jgi:hypothetical protein
MMKTYLRILLLAVLALLTACEKGGTVRQIVYTVDTAAEQHVTTHGDAEFDALLERFCGYAEEGSTVTFHGARAGSPRTKDVVTYSTTSRDEIKAWMRDMEAAGMTVTVTFDPASGTWNGTAYANAPYPRRGVATFVNLSDEGYQGPTVVVTIDSLNRTAYVSYDNEHYTQWHLPVGKFENIWQYDDNILVLYAEGGDTLSFSPLVGDTMILRYFPAEPCWPQHEHYFTVARVREGCQTWYSDQAGGIVMNVWPNIIETYPEGSLALICAPEVPYLNFISPLFTGSCELLRYYTDRAGMDWELSLRYFFVSDSSFHTVDSLGLSGDFLLDRTVTIHDFHRFPGCNSQYMYMFNRID